MKKGNPGAVTQRLNRDKEPNPVLKKTLPGREKQKKTNNYNADVHLGKRRKKPSRVKENFKNEETK